ncbi:hypothetical protein L467_01473 [Klebsiella pneumoniae BIDMC 31]|uniref:Uncharacterized protein n=4 Tax=Enterobacterales TaxID=91347 RepID=A0A486MQ29_KLEPN|nr:MULTISPECIES: hypothetical protein [Klebsiella]ESM29007.1 hypothetical protein L413_01077 [Klebsiella pneumoniae UCICRE 2]ETX41399.1 hypothetical protein L467_01473 [Klebsiella pneumoniae BIDMC 31]SAT31402.1 Uncharacterised protein [Klebsiella pneumoniae]SBW94154.1 Uncharacterised protein [Klebsiella pneumoniae]SCA15487.1 Uncharacterised protein [Klebsiella pneumoniae]
MEAIINMLVSMFDVLSNFLSNVPEWATAFTTALIGAVIGGRYTLKGVEKEAEINKKASERDSLELKLSVLKGIKGEITTLLSLYDVRMKEHIDDIGPGKILAIGFPVGDDNFTFYEQNAKEIAKLSDESRDGIINIYTYARSLIQSFKGNNELIKEVQEMNLLQCKYKDDVHLKTIINNHLECMIDYAQGIKLIDGETRQAISDGMLIIDKEIDRITSLLK